MFYKLAFAIIIASVAAILGAQAIVAIGVAATVVALGPARMKSLPRAVREDAGLHLGAMFLAAVGAFGFSILGKAIDGDVLKGFASLSSWLCLWTAFVVGGFHVTCYPMKIKAREKAAVRVAAVTPEALSLAS